MRIKEKLTSNFSLAVMTNFHILYTWVVDWLRPQSAISFMAQEATTYAVCLILLGLLGLLFSKRLNWYNKGIIASFYIWACLLWIASFLTVNTALIIHIVAGVFVGLMSWVILYKEKHDNS